MTDQSTFILSVDTEEEWDWDGPFPQSHFSVNNTQALPGFNEFCHSLNVRPTYFVDYAVLNDVKAASVMRGINAFGGAEIGAHLHPWCNPPYFGETDDKKSHVINLPVEQTKAKLIQLTQKIKDVLYVQPQSFRTGRWGVNGEVLKLLVELGYKVDSSVYPFYKSDYFDCHGADMLPYYPDYQDVLVAGQQRDIIEVPVSSGFNRSTFSKMSKLHNYLEQPPFNALRTIGFLWRTGLLRKVHFSPEMSTAKDMISLVKTMYDLGYRQFHMYLHSSSLIPGASALTNRRDDIDAIQDKIESVVNYLNSISNVSFCTVTEAAEKWQVANEQQ